MAKGASGIGGGARNSSNNATNREKIEKSYMDQIAKANSIDELDEIVEKAANDIDTDLSDVYSRVYDAALAKAQSWQSQNKNDMFTSKEGTTVSFNSNAANNIMDIPVETRTTRANPRTQAALEKSESLTRLQNELNDAPVGTSFGFIRANGNVDVFEKVSYNFGHQQGWTRTTMEKNGSVAYGGGYPKQASSTDFVSTINTIKSISTPMTQADQDRYKRFRQDTDFSDVW